MYYIQCLNSNPPLFNLKYLGYPESAAISIFTHSVLGLRYTTIYNITLNSAIYYNLPAFPVYIEILNSHDLTIYSLGG